MASVPHMNGMSILNFGRSRSLLSAGSAVRLDSKALVFCKASNNGRVEISKETHIHAIKLLADIANSPNKEERAGELVEDLNREFFYSASAYLSKAKEDANFELASQVEAALQAASSAKAKTYRPEIQVFNKLLKNNSPEERRETIMENHQYFHEGSYFFQLLEQVMKEEAEKDSQERSELMRQLRIIDMQTRAVAKQLKRTTLSSPMDDGTCIDV